VLSTLNLLYLEMHNADVSPQKSWEGTAIHIWRWSNLVVTLALKFKVAVYHARNFKYSRLYMCT